MALDNWRLQILGLVTLFFVGGAQMPVVQEGDNITSIPAAIVAQPVTSPAPPVYDPEPTDPPYHRTPPIVIKPQPPITFPAPIDLPTPPRTCMNTCGCNRPGVPTAQVMCPLYMGNSVE